MTNEKNNEKIENQNSAKKRGRPKKATTTTTKKKEEGPKTVHANGIWPAQIQTRPVRIKMYLEVDTDDGPVIAKEYITGIQVSGAVRSSARNIVERSLNSGLSAVSLEFSRLFNTDFARYIAYDNRDIAKIMPNGGR